MVLVGWVEEWNPTSDQTVSTQPTPLLDLFKFHEAVYFLIFEMV
jgi:hypothetical protein